VSGDRFDDPVDALRRWEASGAGWRVAHRSAAGLEIELLTCTGEEVVGAIRSADPRVLAFVGERTRNDDRQSD